MSNIIWDFTGKTVLVVGASRGIGKGVADFFTSAKADVWSIDSTNCDISNKKSIDEYTFKVFNAISSVDILVNVAGINYTKRINEISFEEWNEVVDTNLRGFFYITKLVLDTMPDGGRIVNVSSIAGRHRSLVSGVHYTASKAGIIGLTKQVAYEVGDRNITVNAVCPSQTKTEMLLQSMSEQEIDDLGKTIPLNRIASVEEVVNSILFLCSDEASYITGTTLDVNGGQL